MSFRTISEPTKRIPVIFDVDVAVAGAGVSSVFAAAAAARQGARTVIVDRFPSVGGNIGPGMIVNGGMLPGSPHPAVGHERTVYPGMYGIAREFIHRYAELGGGGLQPYQSQPYNYAGSASIASYVLQCMLEESGVELLLSTTVADPVMEANRVRGLFVENKSGRSAIAAKVVIDGTGEADVAKRSGAPMLLPRSEHHEIDAHSPTGMGTYFLVAGVDWDRYVYQSVEPNEDDVRWAEKLFHQSTVSRFQPVLRALRSEYEAGTFDPEPTVQFDGVDFGLNAVFVGPIDVDSSDVIEGRAAIARDRDEFNVGDGRHISVVEAALRAHVFEVWRFWKRHAAGFERSSLLCVAPYMGARGGPCIEGEYTLTMDDCRAGALFDDVIYRYGEFRALRWTAERGEVKWVDMPYRVLLPKGIDGLLATGRAASGKPDTLLRNRWAVKVMGEACGIAAALCAQDDISPRELDRKVLQHRLLDSGFFLGDRSRLKDLGLV